MPMRFLMQTVRDFFSDRFSRAIGVLGAISALNSLFFIRAKDALEFFPYLIENPFFCYLAYAIITLSLWIILVLAYRILPWQKMFAAIFFSSSGAIAHCRAQWEKKTRKTACAHGRARRAF